jgi:hypothetical protein
MAFVFASMVELAIIGYKMRNEGNQTIKIKDIGKKRKASLIIFSSSSLDFSSKRKPIQ